MGKYRVTQFFPIVYLDSHILYPLYTQHVPIPTSTYVCQRNGGCCTRTNLPLTLAYARTIHKFQGQSAGPVDEGKIPNIYSCIICDPDKGDAEGRALGMLYTAVSRATTLGDDDGLNSAIYFTGDDFIEKRIRNLGKRKKSMDEFQNVTRRKIWVQHHLANNMSDGGITTEQLERALDWANTATIDYDRLHSRVKFYIQSKVQRRHHVDEEQQSASNNSKRQRVQ